MKCLYSILIIHNQRLILSSKTKLSLLLVDFHLKTKCKSIKITNAKKYSTLIELMSINSLAINNQNLICGKKELRNKKIVVKLQRQE